MREMRHENINQFIGAIIDAPNIAVMFIYCARGNLEVRYVLIGFYDFLIIEISDSSDAQDVLRNKDINLDNMFIASLVADLIKVGVNYQMMVVVHVTIYFCFRNK